MSSLEGNFDKSRKSEFIPNYARPRCRCPFYGFYYSSDMGIFLDQEGNQCSIITNKYSPCQMIIEDKVPNWKNCSFSGSDYKDIVSEMIVNSIVFPKEFYPQEKEKWEGLPMSFWIKYIME